MLTVSTFFWNDPARKRGYQFNHDHVRILQSMVKRNLSLPHRFICVSDDSIDGVETVPLSWDKHVPSTCYVRLCLRNPEFQKRLGTRILNLDLDMVVVGSLDPLVDRPEPSVFWRNPNWPSPGRAYYQTSIQLLSAGAYRELYDDFNPKNPCLDGGLGINWRFGGAEQAWVSERLPWNLPQWTEADGIYGAGRLGDWKSDRIVDLPRNAKIISFPGNRIPDQPEVQAKFPWIRAAYR